MDIQRIKKYLVLGFLCVLGIVVVSLAIRILFYGSTKIVIDGAHNPLITQVQLGEQVLFPSGNNGSEYSFSGRTGDYELSVTGPLLLPTNETVQIGPFTTSNTVVATQKRTIEDIVSATVEPAAGSTLNETQLYGLQKDWITSQTESKTIAIRPVFYVLQYTNKNWVVVDSGEKLNPELQQYKNAPQDLINYIADQAGD